jgi:hypothetical protein
MSEYAFSFSYLRVWTSFLLMTRTAKVMRKLTQRALRGWVGLRNVNLPFLHVGGPLARCSVGYHNRWCGSAHNFVRVYRICVTYCHHKCHPMILLWRRLQINCFNTSDRPKSEAGVFIDEFKVASLVCIRTFSSYSEVIIIVSIFISAAHCSTSFWHLLPERQKRLRSRFNVYKFSGFDGCECSDSDLLDWDAVWSCGWVPALLGSILSPS